MLPPFLICQPFGSFCQFLQFPFWLKQDTPLSRLRPCLAQAALWPFTHWRTYIDLYRRGSCSWLASLSRPFPSIPSPFPHVPHSPELVPCVFPDGCNRAVAAAFVAAVAAVAVWLVRIFFSLLRPHNKLIARIFTYLPLQRRQFFYVWSAVCEAVSFFTYCSLFFTFLFSWLFICTPLL